MLQVVHAELHTAPCARERQQHIRVYLALDLKTAPSNYSSFQRSEKKVTSSKGRKSANSVMQQGPRER